MVTVAYPHELPYRFSPAGGTFPILAVTLSAPYSSSRSVDVLSYLDSGAQRSMFDGSLAELIGLDLLAGRRLTFGSAAGLSIEGLIHPFLLSHPDLGSFPMEIGFSTVPLRRNLLGRDFFSLVQIGFRERQQAFFIRVDP